MHLALVISSLNAGGAERVLSMLANHWVAQNHQVTFITLAPPHAVPFYTLDSKIKIIQLDQSSQDTAIFLRIKNIAKRLFSLRKTITSLKPDRVISFVDIMNITTLIATRGLKIPVIVSERIDPNFHHISNLYNWIREKIYVHAYKVIVQKNNAKTYVTHNQLISLKIIPNFVEKPLQIKKTYAQKITRFITIGRLESQKDHSTLIHAFARLVPIYPELSLTIYGEGTHRNTLENLINSLNMKDKIYLPGTTQNVYQTLLTSDLFIFPSHYEGFPNALCEAMATGLPVIASNCSGNIDVIRDGVDGLLFPVGDVNTLTNTIKILLENPEECQRLATNAQKICDRFHPTRICALWDNLIQNES